MKFIKNFIRRLYYFNSYRNFKKKGKNIILSKGGIIHRPNQVSFGDNVFISRNFHISANNLTFGNNIMIGPNLVIESSNHIYNRVGKIMFEYQKDKLFGSITIENDVWIGANVIILPDTNICEGCVIGAGSIVTKILPPYSICIGSPCKPVKTRFTKEELKEHLARIESKYTFEDVVKKWESHDILIIS